MSGSDGVSGASGPLPISMAFRIHVQLRQAPASSPVSPAEPPPASPYRGAETVRVCSSVTYWSDGGDGCPVAPPHAADGIAPETAVWLVRRLVPAMLSVCRRFIPVWGVESRFTGLSRFPWISPASAPLRAIRGLWWRLWMLHAMRSDASHTGRPGRCDPCRGGSWRTSPRWSCR